MPEVKQGESEQEWLGRCIPYQLNENPDMEKDQAVAICYSMYEKSKKTNESVEKLIDRIDYLLINEEVNINMVKREIEIEKKKLISKAKRWGLKENWGQDIVRKLENKYHMQMSKDDSIRELINDFDEWCSNVDDNDLKESVLTEASTTDVENFIRDMLSGTSRKATDTLMFKLCKKVFKKLDRDEFQEIWDSLVDDEYLVKAGGQNYKWEI